MLWRLPTTRRVGRERRSAHFRVLRRRESGGRAASRLQMPIRRSPASGAKRDRTADLLRAKQALSQLSYGPFQSEFRDRWSRRWFYGRLVQWASAVEVEVLGRSLLKPETVVLRSVLKEVRRLF